MKDLHSIVLMKGSSVHGGFPFTFPCRKHLRWDLLVMPATSNWLDDVTCGTEGEESFEKLTGNMFNFGGFN